MLQEKHQTFKTLQIGDSDVAVILKHRCTEIQLQKEKCRKMHSYSDKFSPETRGCH